MDFKEIQKIENALRRENGREIEVACQGCGRTIPGRVLSEVRGKKFKCIDCKEKNQQRMYRRYKKRQALKKHETLKVPKRSNRAKETPSKSAL
jgi:hypothetical protein